MLNAMVEFIDSAASQRMVVPSRSDFKDKD